MMFRLSAACRYVTYANHVENRIPLISTSLLILTTINSYILLHDIIQFNGGMQLQYDFCCRHSDYIGKKHRG